MTAPLISTPTAMRSPAVVYTRPARKVVTASAAWSEFVLVPGAPTVLATMKISAYAQPLVVFTSAHWSLTSRK